MAANRKVNNIPHDIIANRTVDTTRSTIMAANRKVNKTTTRSPSWQPIEKLITLPHDRHHGGQ